MRLNVLSKVQRSLVVMLVLAFSVPSVGITPKQRKAIIDQYEKEREKTDDKFEPWADADKDRLLDNMKDESSSRRDDDDEFHFSVNTIPNKAGSAAKKKWGPAAGWGVFLPGLAVTSAVSGVIGAFGYAANQSIKSAAAKPGKQLGEKIYKKFFYTPDLVKKMEILYPEVNQKKGKFADGRVIKGRTKDLIFNRRIAQELEAIRTTYVHAVKNDLPLPAALFYGPYGTGKTDFVERLVNEIANEAPDVPFMMVKLTGRAIADARAEKFTELFRYLETVPKKVFLLIDECEPIFNSSVSRFDENIKGSSSLSSVILSAYGVPSSKFVIIGTTNFPFIYEDAVRSRFPIMRVDLPNAQTRDQLFMRLFWDSKVGRPDALKDTREELQAALRQPFTLPELEKEFVELLQVDEYSQFVDGPEVKEEFKQTKLEKILAFIRQESKVNQLVDQNLEKKFKNSKKDELLKAANDLNPKTIDLLEQLEEPKESKEEAKDQAKDPKVDEQARLEQRRLERAKTYNLIEFSQGISGRDFAHICETYMKKVALFNDGRFSRTWMALSIIDRLADAYNAQEFEAKRKKEMKERAEALRYLAEEQKVRQGMRNEEAMIKGNETGEYPFGAGGKMPGGKWDPNDMLGMEP